MGWLRVGAESPTGLGRWGELFFVLRLPYRSVSSNEFATTSMPRQASIELASSLLVESDMIETLLVLSKNDTNVMQVDSSNPPSPPKSQRTTHPGFHLSASGTAGTGLVISEPEKKKAPKFLLTPIEHPP